MMKQKTKDLTNVPRTLGFAVCAGILLISGCAASDPNIESDIDLTGPTSAETFDHRASSVPEADESENEAAGLTELDSDASWESEPVLSYHDRWTFFVEETPTEDTESYPRGFLSRLMAKDETNGETFDLTGSFYTDLPDYRLYAFTDILDSDGVVFEYSAGSASAPVLLFGVGEDIELLVEGDGYVYTGDPDGDGVKEVVWSTVGAFPFTYISWLQEQGTVACVSLDEAVEEELIRSKMISSQSGPLSLEIREGYNSVTAKWQEQSGGDESSAEVDLGEVLARLRE